MDNENSKKTKQSPMIPGINIQGSEMPPYEQEIITGEKVEETNFLKDENEFLKQRIAELEKENSKMKETNNTPSVERNIAARGKRAPVIETGEKEFTLPNEIVNVEFIKRRRGSVEDEKSPLAWGMSEMSKKEFTVPVLRDGTPVNILTDAEKRFFEKYFNMKEGGLSVYNKPEENYWLNSNENGINVVKLTKAGMRLDLSKPEDYIKWKILLANKDKICPSKEEMKRRDKITYWYVLVNERAAAQNALSRAELKMNCYEKYRQVKDDKRILKYIVEEMEHRRLSLDIKFDFLYTELDVLIDSDPEKFYDLITDPTTTTKALIMECLDRGILKREKGQYFMADTGEPLCDSNQMAYIDTAAKWLSKPANEEVKRKLYTLASRKL